MVYDMHFVILTYKKARLDEYRTLPIALIRWQTAFFGEKVLMVSGY